MALCIYMIFDVLGKYSSHMMQEERNMAKREDEVRYVQRQSFRLLPVSEEPV